MKIGVNTSSKDLSEKNNGNQNSGRIPRFVNQIQNHIHRQELSPVGIRTVHNQLKDIKDVNRIITGSNGVLVRSSHHEDTANASFVANDDNQSYIVVANF